MACHFGFDTNPNRAFWVCFVSFFLTGAIMLPVGLIESMPCTKKYNRCNTSGSECEDQLDECAAHWIRVFIAGIVILIISTIPLCYFCCCAEPPPNSPPPATAVLQAQGDVHPVVAWQAGNANPQPGQQPYPAYQPTAPGQPRPPAYPPVPTNQPYPVHSPAYDGQPILAQPPATNAQQHPAYAPPAAVATQGGAVYPQYALQQQGNQRQAALTPGYGPYQPPPA